MSIDITTMTPQALKELVEKVGGQRQFARKFGIPRTTLQTHLYKEVRQGYMHRPAPEAIVKPVDQPVQRYILSSAQDSTELHTQFLTNLEAYAEFLRKEGPCEIMISGFTYSKKLFQENDPRHIAARKESASKYDDEGKDRVYWDPRIEPYRMQERVRLSDRIDFAGEMNTLPTAATPLSNFETYTRHRWGIFPHAKVQLKSVPTMKDAPAKIIMTTGAVTKTNYLRKRAGLVASFHHAIGAVLVEIAQDGTFFCRHLLGEHDGSFYDLDRHIETADVDDVNVLLQVSPDLFEGQDLFGYVDEKNWEATVITTGHRAKAINWGDLHVAQIDPQVSKAAFGIWPGAKQKGSGQEGRLWHSFGPLDTYQEPLIDVMRPEKQFFHDVADFQSRNHHNMRDPHHMFSLFVDGVDSVEEEMREVAMFISQTRRDFCETVIVESNHDLALRRWLKEADYRVDPRNAMFFLRCQLASYDAIKRRDHSFSIFEHVLTEAFDSWRCDGVRFLREDESYMVGDIEKGMHGHLGANGARGTPAAFTKMGSKATTGHTHSCEIRDGIYTSGTSSKLDLGYNSGLSSWSHSHVVTLPNLKRQIITMQNGKWRL